MGFPPALIRKRDRLRDIGSLEKAQLGGSKEDYYKIIAAAVDRSLDIYLKALSDSPDEVLEAPAPQSLMRIGQLAKATGESNATLRYWTKEGLLEVADTTEANYQLYAPEMIGKVARIRDLQAQRFTIKEIKAKLAKE